MSTADEKQLTQLALAIDARIAGRATANQRLAEHIGAKL
jgi:hypothetical protein